jgi:hypothetical protein
MDTTGPSHFIHVWSNDNVPPALANWLWVYTQERKVHQSSSLRIRFGSTSNALQFQNATKWLQTNFASNCSGTAAHLVEVLYFCGSVDIVSFIFMCHTTTNWRWRPDINQAQTAKQTLWNTKLLFERSVVWVSAEGRFFASARPRLARTALKTRHDYLSRYSYWSIASQPISSHFTPNW